MDDDDINTHGMYNNKTITKYWTESLKTANKQESSLEDSKKN